jgi:hypothetical protein
MRLDRNGLGCLPEAGVDNLKPSFQKGVNNNFGSDIVAVQTRFSDQNLDPPFTHADTPKYSLTLAPDSHKRH